MAGNVLEFTDDNFQTEVLEATVPVVVDFWAEWCGPCRALGPVIEQLSNALGSQAKVGKLIVDNARDVASNYGITNIPTVIIFKNGEPITRFVGLTSLQQLQKAVTEAAG